MTPDINIYINININNNFLLSQDIHTVSKLKLNQPYTVGYMRYPYWDLFVLDFIINYIHE